MKVPVGDSVMFVMRQGMVDTLQSALLSCEQNATTLVMKHCLQDWNSCYWHIYLDVHLHHYAWWLWQDYTLDLVV